MRPRACPADHDADLPDAPQGGSDPPGTGPSCRADSAGRRTGAAGSGSRLSARDAGGTVREPNTMTAPDVLNEAVTFPGVSSRPSKAQRESARTRFPPRPVVTDWPATRHDRGEVWERLTSRRHHRLGQAHPPKPAGQNPRRWGQTT